MIIYKILLACLENKKIYTSPKNFNTEIGLPFSIMGIENYNPWFFGLLIKSFQVFFITFFWEKKYDIILLEYWIDAPNDMDFLLDIVKPDVAIFTKLDAIHLEFFESVEAIGKEKFKMIYNAQQKVYLNYQDEYARKQFDTIKQEKSFYFWKDIEISDYTLEKWESDWIEASFSYNGSKIKTNLLGEENANYIALWYNIVSFIEKDFKLLKENILNFVLQAWRFSIFPWIKESVLIDSTYNAGPESMKKMIENSFLIRNTLLTDYKIVFVLGDMRELGVKTEEAHKNLVSFLKQADKVITIWKEMWKYLWMYKNYISSTEAGKFLKKFLEEQDDKYLILFKGSQNTIFTEETLKQVLKNKEDEKKLVRQTSFWLKKKWI